MHANLTIDIGKECSLLQEWNWPLSYQQPALLATPNDMVLFDTWQERLKKLYARLILMTPSQLMKAPLLSTLMMLIWVHSHPSNNQPCL